MTFLDGIGSDTSQLIQFISRAPALKSFRKARVAFDENGARVNLSSQTHGYGELFVKIPFFAFHEQLSSLVQVCTSCLPPLSTLEDVYIYEEPDLYADEDSDWQPDWQGSTENELWMELLYSFAAVKNLYLSRELAPLVASALRGLVRGRMAEVLPTLQNMFLERSWRCEEGIKRFIAVRRVTNHPIAVSCWHRDSEQERNQSLRNAPGRLD
jgi:hypothetical protein